MTTCGGGFAIAQMSAVMFRHTMSVAYISDWGGEGGPALDWVRRAERALKSRPCAAPSGRLLTLLDAAARRQRVGWIGACTKGGEAPAL